MNQLTEEQRERVRQIREGLVRVRRDPSLADPGYAPPLWDDIDFLLSLRDGHEAECDAADWAIERVQSEYLRGRSDAATAMRDACVEKVKAMGQQWYGEAKKRGAAFSDKGRLAETIAAELESLTLDQVQEKR